MAYITINATNGAGSVQAWPREPSGTLAAAAAKGRPHIACHKYHADHAFARIDGVHWDGRSAVIANGRGAEALVKAPG